MVNASTEDNTPPTQTATNKEAAIWSRLVEPERPSFTPAAARAILGLAFYEADKDRMKQLMAKAKEGNLTPEEQADIEAYSRVGSLLGILKSKARKSLRNPRSKGVRARAQ